MSASYPISRLNLQLYQIFKSPLQRIRTEFQGICREKLEKIKPYIILLWEPRISYDKYTLINNVNAAEILLREDRLLIIIIVVVNEHRIMYGIAQASKYI